MTFEENYASLQEVTKRLEEGNLSLEESVALYTQGVRLVAACQEALNQAKLVLTTETVPEEAPAEEEGTEADDETSL